MVLRTILSYLEITKHLYNKQISRFSDHIIVSLVCKLSNDLMLGSSEYIESSAYSVRSIFLSLQKYPYSSSVQISCSKLSL